MANDGIPSQVEPAPTPIRPPMVDGDQPHIDLEATITKIFERVHARPPNSTFVSEYDMDSYERKVRRAQRWGGWIWGLFSILGVMFSAGVYYAVFIGENATDAEVREKTRAAIIEHNEHIDPSATDSATHKPVGSHPQLRKAVQKNSEAIFQLNATTKSISSTQKKLDKRSQYQFEFSRWQADVIEASRKRRRPPSKPPELRRLENEIFQGDYD